MYVHLSDADPWSRAPLEGSSGGWNTWSGARRTDPAVVQQPRRPDHRATVIDLNEHIDAEAYEIRGRLREQTILVHPTCVVPCVPETCQGLNRTIPRHRDHQVGYAGETQLLLQHCPAVPAASTGPRPTAAGPTPPSTAGRIRTARVPVPATSTVP